MKKLKLFQKTYLFTMALMGVMIIISHTLLYMLLPTFYINKKQQDLSDISTQLIQQLESNNKDMSSKIAKDFSNKYGINIALNIKNKNYVFEGIKQYDIYIKPESLDSESLIINNNVEFKDSENSSESIENKEGYLKLRKDYNSGNKDPIMFYTLLCYAFNYQIRFNSKGNYNMPFGKDRSSFNPTLRKKFIDFHNKISKIDCVFLNKSFEEFDFSDFTAEDFIYADPPYYNSVATYNENGGWTEECEYKLLKLLDELNEAGIRFALSNNLRYENPTLDNWKNKYKTHYLKHDYSNCNYQKKDKSNDVEVLITNY